MTGMLEANGETTHIREIIGARRLMHYNVCECPTDI